MSHAGTFDGGNIAFWVVLCFTLPIALALFGRIMWAVVAFIEAVAPAVQRIEIPVQVEVEKIVYRDREKIVYRDRVKTPKATSSATVEAPTSNTDPQIVSDTVDALKGLGFRVTDIKGAIKDLCASKSYPDAESLLNDCLGRLK